MVDHGAADVVRGAEAEAVSIKDRFDLLVVSGILIDCERQRDSSSSAPSRMYATQTRDDT